MSYRLDLSAPLDGDVRRIARAQVDKAIADLSRAGDAAPGGVHEARKRLKRLRGLLRLVRSGDAEFAREEGRRYRDAGRLLSGARDRTALIEALGGLREWSGAKPEAAGFLAVEHRLAERRREAVERAGREAGDALAEARARLGEGRARLDALAFSRMGRGRRDRVLLDGLERNYRQGRADLLLAQGDGDTEAFHDLRKRMKYLGMHLRLLAPVWPGPLEALRLEADAAAEALGRDHDYAVLRAEMEAEPGAFGSAPGRRGVASALDRHGAALRREALGHAARLLAEKPAAFRQRFDGLLRTARDR